MIAFEWPLIFFVLPLPWLFRKLIPASNPQQQAALKVPFLEDFARAKTQSSSQLSQWPLILASIAWCLLVFASSRPQWLGEPIEQAISGRDLMLAVDLSSSMKEQDFFINNKRVDRLTATKQVAGEFIQRRTGDRIGLILFGTHAYLQTPLTFDRQTVLTLLYESALGLAGENTAIGDAIGLAVKRLRKQSIESRVLIVLTDGANTAGEVSPLKAAELAADNQLKIYTIGIGADEMIVRSFFGSRRINPSIDLDEKTLIAIAEKTQGRYFRARNTEELEQIYQLIDQLEPIEKDKQYFRPRSELYPWPLALALSITAVISLFRLRDS
jgi:Ca-activated chloride channel family protein